MDENPYNGIRDGLSLRAVLHIRSILPISRTFHPAMD
jgi:hypothetical protein